MEYKEPDQKNLVDLVASDPVPGETVLLPAIAGYHVLTKVGTGSLTDVYKVRRDGIDDIFVAKILRREYADNPRTAKRFVQESEKATGLNDAHLVAVFAVCRSADNRPVLICDYVDGGNLVDRLIAKQEAGISLSEAAVLKLFNEILQGLNQAHKKGIIHRDIKPANIVFQLKQGTEIVKIADFGIAKVLPSVGRETKYFTPEGDAFGNPTYMSPEQLQGGRLDARSDIYSLGCVLYECLAGRPPFRSSNPLRLALKQVQEEMPPIASVNEAVIVSPGMEIVLKRMLQKDPECRYQSVDELIADLKIVAAHGLPHVPVVTSAKSNASAASSPVVAEKDLQAPHSILFKGSLASESVNNTPGQAKLHISAADVERSMAGGRQKSSSDKSSTTGLPGSRLVNDRTLYAIAFAILLINVFAVYSYFISEKNRPAATFDASVFYPKISSPNNGSKMIPVYDRAGSILFEATTENLAAAIAAAAQDGLSLKKLKAPDLNFAGLNLSGADLAGADLSGCNFVNADLRGANFSDATLNGANFDGANLSGCTLIYADLDCCSLLGANCDGARFDYANLNDATVSIMGLERAFTDNAVGVPAQAKGVVKRR